MAEQKATCAITGKEFTISEGEQELLREFDLPLPTTHPIERYLYMISASMPFKFNKITCPKTGKQILSRWATNGSLTAVDPEWFWSDECDNVEAGQEYDFNRPFWDQFAEVAKRAYTPSINRINCENSPYVNASFNMKDSHLCFACHDMQDSLYCLLGSDSTDLLLCAGCGKCELCYACLDCNGCYGSRWLQDCKNCTSCYWCLDCTGCTNCFGCVGLRQAKDGYYIYNQKVSAEEWEEKVGGLDMGSYEIEQQMNEHAQTFFADKWGYSTEHNNEECSGVNHTTNCRNCHNAWYTNESQDCRDLMFCDKAADSYSSMWLNMAERCYMVAGSSNAQNCFCCDGAIEGEWQMSGLCSYNGSSHILGCVFLKKKSYCILNKQYTKEEYEELLPRVIAHMKSTGEWGTYPPPKTYGGGYRDSWGYLLLGDLTDEQIERRNFYLEGDPDRLIDSGLELPDRASDFTPEMLDKEIRCEESGKPYAISARELAVFSKIKAPIPRRHWSVILTKMMRLSIDLGGHLDGK